MSKTFAYIGLVMSLVFIGFSILIVVSPPKFAWLLEYPSMKYVLSFIVLVYGLFRMQRSIRILQHHKNNRDR